MLKRRSLARAFTLVAALALAGVALSSAGQTGQGPSRYLFTWVGDEGREDSDFLAVVDLAPQGDRYGMWMLNVNRSTGELAVDRAFRDVDSTRPGVAFDRAAWPHGPTGTGVPHGTVFGW